MKIGSRDVIVPKILITFLVFVVITSTFLMLRPIQPDALSFKQDEPYFLKLAVIMAKPPFEAGRALKTNTQVADMMENLSDYYYENTYGGIIIDWTVFSDSGNWFTVPGSYDYYGRDREENAVYSLANKYFIYEADRTVEFAFDAIKSADSVIDYEDYDIVAVMYPGDSAQFARDNSLIQSEAIPLSVKLNHRETTKNWITVAENDPLGAWAHEVGHLLKRALDKNSSEMNYDDVVADKYEGSTGGDIGGWGLMGLGLWRGDPLGSRPTHMCSHTKNFIGLLNYENIGYGTRWIGALESLNVGDNITIHRLPDGSFYILEVRSKQCGVWDQDLEMYLGQNESLVIYKVHSISDYITLEAVLSLGFTADMAFVDRKHNVAITPIDMRADNDSIEMLVKVCKPGDLPFGTIVYPSSEKPHKIPMRQVHCCNSTCDVSECDSTNEIPLYPNPIV